MGAGFSTHSFILLICLVLLQLPFSQLNGQVDSSIFTYNEYLENLLLFHPVAKLAGLQSKVADAQWMSAKGNLDPVITSDFNQKSFDENLYFRNFYGKLKVPTILGVDFVGGYENTEGVFLNPENLTDDFGLWHVGIEVNVLQGLIVNERRTAIDQARVFRELAENERQLILNDLLLDASMTYLEWQQFHYSKLILLENIDLAQNYFGNTRTSFLNGEMTAMDTLEAFILFRDAQNLLQKNELDLVKARQQVENYLWLDEIPLELQLNTIPEDYKNDLFSVNLDDPRDDLALSNPMILSTQNKRSIAEIEQRLKREQLKPKLKINFNPLLTTNDNAFNPSYSSSNYKWGFDFSMPFPMRSERADVQLGQIKIQELNFAIEDKINALNNKLDASVLGQSVLREQLQILDDNVVGYRLLLEGENEKFNFGESSVFLLNRRQDKYIEGQLKLTELNIKLNAEQLRYLYFSNMLIPEN